MGPKLFRNPDRLVTFTWRVAATHTVAYFIAGIISLNLLNYSEHYASDTMSLLMKPVSSPIVPLGPALQILRGIILALALYSFRKVIFGKNGYWKLALLIFVLSLFSTIGPTPSSFDGVIYTILPFVYHLMGLPEAIIYIALLVGILFVWNRYNKTWIDILMLIFVVIIIVFGIMGYISFSEAAALN